ncbi:MAG TPA: hypothetical protein VJM09_08415 [Sphingobium sp.]|nr:hypothetical protein [Sphingobium sp.]
MTTVQNHGPLWTQDQAIAFEAALEAVNDVIAGYSEQIDIEENSRQPDVARIAWLNMRIGQAVDVRHALSVTDTANVQQVLMEFSAIVRARDAVEAGCERSKNCHLYEGQGRRMQTFRFF